MLITTGPNAICEYITSLNNQLLLQDFQREQKLIEKRHTEAQDIQRKAQDRRRAKSRGTGSRGSQNTTLLFKAAQENWKTMN